MQRRGEPDVLGVEYVEESGIVIPYRIEVKKPGGEPSELQLLRLSEYNRQNCCIGILTDVDQMPILRDSYILWRTDRVPRPTILWTKWLDEEHRELLNYNGWKTDS